MSLTPKQSQVLLYLTAFQESKGYAPSVREIGEAVGLSSTSSVHAHLNHLEEQGYIRKDPMRPRSIEILIRPGSEQDSERFFKETSEQVIPFASVKGSREVMAVPILGRVRAGEPLLAVENIEDYYPVPVDFTHNSECFMLRVQGESMIKAGIFENDLILVRAQKTAVSRDIVVALLGDSVTVKTFYKEKNYIRLQPENDYMEPILIKECQILGKVIGLFRFIR